MMRDEFAKKFAAWITFFGCVFLMYYLFLPVIIKVWMNKDIVYIEDSKTILGFVMGTIVTTAINWAIGTSKTSEDKTYLKQGVENEKEENSSS